MTMTWAERLADRLDPRPDPYLTDPVGWVRDRLDEHLTAAQRAIAESVVENRYTAVPSCHDVGKSFTGSRIVAWWIDVHDDGEAFAVTTAPTAAQVGAILWREIGRAHRRGGLGGYVTGNNEWKLSHGPASPAELVAYGRKPADYDPAAFQGIHARYPIIVIDEACGVPRTIYDAVDSLATNENARVLAIGNPDDPASHFREVCKPGSGWNVIELDALRSPNFTRERIRSYPLLLRYMIANGIPPSTEEVPERVRDLLVSPLWVEERLKRWGATSPVFTSKVRGRFPEVAIDTLISPSWVTRAQARELPEVETNVAFGVDVARYGTDRTIIMLRRGGHVRVVDEIAYGPVTEAAGHVLREAERLAHRIRPIAYVDDDGVGGGVTDILQERGYPVVGLHGSSAATELMDSGKPRFVNARSERWWRVREALAGPSGTGDDGWLDLDPADDELAAQLTNVKYRVNSHGQIQVESKDEMRKRRLPSPDRGDALTYVLETRRPDDDTPREDDMITGGLLSMPL